MHLKGVCLLIINKKNNKTCNTIYIYINMQNMMSPDPKVAKYRPTINADLQVMHMYITESIQGIHILN